MSEDVAVPTDPRLDPRQPPLVVADPCPHGIPANLCQTLCIEDPAAIATVSPNRPVGYALALDCHLAGHTSHRLSDTQLLDAIAGAERLERWITALRTRMIGVFAVRHPPGSKAAPPGADPHAIAPVSRWLPDQLAIVLGVSIEEARALLAGALRFVQVLPATLADWEAGHIDERKAAAIAQSTGVLSDELAREVEAAILPGAAQAHRRLLRDRLRRAIAKADPEGAKRRHEKAKADRRMSISRGEDGMASLYLGGTAEQTEASWQSVDRLARAVGKDDPRTLDQKRLDLAHQLLQGTLTITDLGSVRTAVDSVLAAAAAGAASTGTAADPGPTDTGAAGAAIPVEMVAEAVAQALQHKPDPNEVIGRKPLIHVVVSLDTLLGGDRPAEIVGHGPIPALTARALAAGGVWKRLVTDPLSGTLLDHGRTTYSPPDGLADHVKARDVVCRGPLCSRPIRELDHHTPWAGGGETSEENLLGFCQRDHKLKDAPGWQVITGPDKSLTWVSPTGHRRTTWPPYDYRHFTDPMPEHPGRTDPGADGPSTGNAGAGDAGDTDTDTDTDTDAAEPAEPGVTAEPGTTQSVNDPAAPDDVPPPF